MIDPFDWDGVVETPTFFALAPVNSLVPEVDPLGQMQIRYKPQETAVTQAAKQSYAGRVFLDWAQYPITETEVRADDSTNNNSAAYIVRFRDLRYDYPGSPARATLGASVLLTRDLKIVDERFGMRSASKESP